MLDGSGIATMRNPRTFFSSFHLPLKLLSIRLHSWFKKVRIKSVFISGLDMKTILKIGMVVITMGILANLLFGGGADNDADIPTLIKNGALVIDVRTAGEFSGGHIEGAINISHNVISRDIAQHEKNKANTVIVYCHSGARSGSAKRVLTSAGYTSVINGGSLHRMRKILGQ